MIFAKRRVFMIRVMLLGDSVRMFYQEKTKEILGENYEVWSPKENCRFSLYLLNSLRFYLAEFPSPDIIHFNAGLWDTAVLYKCDGCFASADEYVRNMKKILRELKKTGAEVVFATTTPVADEKYKLDGPMPPAHRNGDIISYNRAVLDAFKDENIVINDLHALIYPDREKYISDDMIHPNEDGINVLGERVANVIKQQKITGKNVGIESRKLVLDEKTVQ